MVILDETASDLLPRRKPQAAELRFYGNTCLGERITGDKVIKDRFQYSQVVDIYNCSRRRRQQHRKAFIQ